MTECHNLYNQWLYINDSPRNVFNKIVLKNSKELKKVLPMFKKEFGHR